MHWKSIVLSFILSYISLDVDAQHKNTYWLHHKPKPVVLKTPAVREKPIYMVPRYQIPKGHIFCRMEDIVTRKTNVWLVVGVGR